MICCHNPFAVASYVAAPAPCPHYVIPCSHLLDPPYSIPTIARAREPRPFESAARPCGTGLIWGPQRIPCPQPWGR